MSDVQQDGNIRVKRFGYVISALLIILSNIGLVEKWSATPILFLITMYFLTGSLWVPKLVAPFYKWFKLLINYNDNKDDDAAGKNFFNKN